MEQQRKENINNGSEYANLEDRLSSLPDSLLITIFSLLPIDAAAATSVLSSRLRHLCIQVFSCSLLPCIHQICRLTPELIKVKILFFGDGIPNTVLETQSLVELKLKTNMEFNFPRHGIPSIHLYYLMKLDLFLRDSHRPLMNAHFKSCPLLEDLHLEVNLTENNHFIDISAPNLKYLCTLMSSSASDYCKVVIDAPKLEHFHVQGCFAFYNFVASPCNLQKVRFSIYNDDPPSLSGFIQGISCVRSLELFEFSGSLFNCLRGLDSAVSVFPNLVHFFKDIKCWRDPLPSCLLRNLKKLEISRLMGGHDEISWLSNILSDAPVLEQLHVFVFSHHGAGRLRQFQIECNFFKELFAFARFRSLGCEINLSSMILTISSKDSRGGLHVVRLVKDIFGIDYREDINDDHVEDNEDVEDHMQEDE